MDQDVEANQGFAIGMAMTLFWIVVLSKEAYHDKQQMNENRRSSGGKRTTVDWRTSLPFNAIGTLFIMLGIYGTIGTYRFGIWSEWPAALGFFITLVTFGIVWCVGGAIQMLKEAYHGQCIGCHREIEMGPTGCMDCHVKRAVQAVPSEKPVKVAAADGPESLTLNRLENRYESVIFSHGMHSEMTESCAACHHHSPAGQTPSCGECHGKPFDPEKLGTPGLKGAYHLQCMGCHKEMGSGPMGCTDCHDKKVAPATKTGGE